MQLDRSKHQGITQTCDQCEYQTSSKADLARHQKHKHELDCEAVFAYKKGLTRHTTSIHEGVRYSCDQCNEQYNESADLKRHCKIVHEGVRYT